MNTNPFAKWLLAPLIVLGGCTKDIPADSETCLPHFEAGWIRTGPAGMPMMGGFGRIENSCAEDVAVVAASSGDFADVSLHRTISEDGMSRMRPVPRLEVKSGTAAVLEPGGLHLMLMQPSAPLEAGDTVSVTLTLEDGRELPAELVVQANAP
jgi:hypothetical protein